MNRNYYQKFQIQRDSADRTKIENGQKPSLLLHACCCPCSTHCLTVLYEHFDITIYFYNPNIDEKEEYEKRYGELIRLTKEADFAKEVKIVDGSYEPEKFYAMAEGRENLPERGARCYDCYDMRMRKTAEYALEKHFDYFSTTLSISPYKNADWLNEIGCRLEEEMREKYSEKQEESEDSIPEFLFSDFKKENGYKHSIQLSNEYNLYRQDYCGCKFSKRDHEAKLAARAALENEK